MKIFKHVPLKSHSILGLFLAGSLLFLLSTCSGPKTVKVSVQGALEMNQKQACIIYIYQLSNNTKFMEASLDSFWKEEAQAFKEDLVKDGIKIQLFPGEAVERELIISEETKFIGAAADFFKPKKEGWRKVFSLDSKVPKNIIVLIKYDSVEITY